jgi:hypothetical protein
MAQRASALPEVNSRTELNVQAILEPDIQRSPPMQRVKSQISYARLEPDACRACAPPTVAPEYLRERSGHILRSWLGEKPIDSISLMPFACGGCPYCFRTPKIRARERDGIWGFNEVVSVMLPSSADRLCRFRTPSASCSFVGQSTNNLFNMTVVILEP